MGIKAEVFRLIEMAEGTNLEGSDRKILLVFSLNLTEFHCSPGNGARYVKWTAFILEH